MKHAGSLFPSKEAVEDLCVTAHMGVDSVPIASAKPKFVTVKRYEMLHTWT